MNSANYLCFSENWTTICAFQKTGLTAQLPLLPRHNDAKILPCGLVNTFINVMAVINFARDWLLIFGEEL